MDFEINYLAVLVCGIASMVLGYLWYGPLFSVPWMKEMGIDRNNQQLMSEMQGKAKWAYPQQFIGALIMAYVFAHVLQAFGSDSVGMALQGALWTWLGFIATVKYGEILWSGKSMKLFFIDSGYHLVQLAIYAIILQLW